MIYQYDSNGSDIPYIWNGNEYIFNLGNVRYINGIIDIVSKYQFYTGFKVEDGNIYLCSGIYCHNNVFKICLGSLSELKEEYDEFVKYIESCKFNYVKGIYSYSKYHDIQVELDIKEIGVYLFLHTNIKLKDIISFPSREKIDAFFKLADANRHIIGMIKYNLQILQNYKLDQHSVHNYNMKFREKLFKLSDMVEILKSIIENEPNITLMNLMLKYEYFHDTSNIKKAIKN